MSNQFSSSNFAKIVTSRDGKSGREGWREIECVSERARRTCCVTYAALQTSQIILSCICIMCIGMATHLDRKSTCTVIETNMVILFSAYLDYFSLTNQSREVTCDFGFAIGVGAGCDGCYDDRDFLKSSLLLSSYAIVKNNSIFPLTEKENIRIRKNLTDIEELFKNFSSLIVYQYIFYCSFFPCGHTYITIELAIALRQTISKNCYLTSVVTSMAIFISMTFVLIIPRPTSTSMLGISA